MKQTTLTYIYSFFISFLLVLTGCTDEILYDDREYSNNSDRITFTGGVTATDAYSTRGGGPLYDPLVLNGDTEEFPLYLHTWEHPLDEGAGSIETATRGVQISNVKDLYEIHSSFGVRASFEDSGTSYISMSKTKMLSTSTNNIWTTESPNRWPGDKRLYFNAVAPHDHIPELQNAVYGKNTIAFSYSAMKGDGTNDAEEQVDLLTAVSTLNRSEAKPYHYRIPLKFKHALSAIKFAVRDVVKGKVISISIKGVHGQGDCIYSADDDSGNGSFEWSNQTGNETYSQVFNHEIEDGKFNPADSSGDVCLTETMPEKTFMLIPQIIPDDATIEVEIERYNVAPGLSSKIKVSGKIRDNSLKEWKAGHEYVYTISTSKDNWVYIFEAEGNESEGKDNIYVYNPNHERFDYSGNIAEFYVKSYRYRANDQNYIEPLPWKATHDGSYSYLVNGSSETLFPADNPDTKYVSASEWITDTFETPLRGAGSVQFEEHCLDMRPHYITTNWQGDRDMQAYKPYSGFDKEHPYDLSTFGGKIRRTTANCYIVDRGGWYMFPLVYGNAVKNGTDNKDSYICQKPSPDITRVLQNLVDYNNEAITGPDIRGVTQTASAQLIWEDAYQLVSRMEVVEINGEKMIRFYVEPNDIQQGNAIVALTDKEDGTVMWSWHIWITEHWLNPDPEKRVPHAFAPGEATFNAFIPAPKTGIRQRGDVKITNNQHGQAFMMSPYNLGWCDPKQLAYLKRKGQMNYVQYMPDGITETGQTAQLPIIQDGAIVDYRYGNNTYYQWGRKDPMCGFINHDQARKTVFGPRPYTIGSQTDISIGDAIKNPQIFYGKSGKDYSPNEDWFRWGGKQNLWNNHAATSLNENLNVSYQEDLWCHVKTVYDPCPAGYMVPNAGIWRFAYKENDASLSWTENSGDIDWFKEHINGEYIDNYNYKIWGSGNPDDSNAVFFSSTGNIWWTDDQPIEERDDDGNVVLIIYGGGNFGRNISYAWSNRFVNTSHLTAYGLALGLDTNQEDQTIDLKYFIGAQFMGRRAIGRPVRAIQEP